jgi:phosphonate transport system permease protein
MPVVEVRGEKSWCKNTPLDQFRLTMGWLIGFVLVVVCWQVIARNTLWFLVWDAPQQVSEFISRMFPPRWEYLSELWLPLWDTFNIATLGTALAVILAVPLAFLAAQNTTPHPVVRQIALLTIVTSRTINSLIWALILVALLGPGSLAGVFAIMLRSVGFVGKLLYEQIEEISTEPVEAITATGASQAQILAYGIVPQVLPAFVGISVFRWDINIRESAVLGLVGAGGIGVKLQSSVNGLQWFQVSVIFACIFVMVLMSEWVSARVRKAII